MPTQSVARSLRLSFLTLQPGNAVRDALHQPFAPRHDIQGKKIPAGGRG
ncbi:DUF1534 domain-containing protein [Pseudomonas syringae]|nr:DUF1534 domain-containing protein [Pseudomonas syringae]MCF5497501.1 DUF1534 domain-containing protein [Pseudomonas syringae]